jgi:hypothetical protein
MSVSQRSTRRGRVTATAAALLTTCSFAFAASANAAGNFVIGDQQAAVGTHVTFWGAQWWKLNSLSGGSAPAAFKGFANTIVSPSACGGVWSTDPGNSSDPPAGPLPPLIDVLVSSTITKSGRIISGDTTEVVSVATDLGYEGNPGHAGTGTVVGVVCRAGENSGGGEGEESSGGAG